MARRPRMSADAARLCLRDAAVSRLTDQLHRSAPSEIVVIFFSGQRSGTVLFEFAFLRGALVCQLSYSA
jgi:hypothetical protein